MLLKGGEAGCGVHDGDNALKARVPLKSPLHDKRLQDGNRIGQTGRFDDDASEGCESAFPAKYALQRISQTAAQAAAHASAVQNDRILAASFDENVVEANVAEFVDDNRCVLQFGLAEHCPQERCLAATEKSGEKENRNCHGASMAEISGEGLAHAAERLSNQFEYALTARRHATIEHPSSMAAVAGPHRGQHFDPKRYVRQRTGCLVGSGGSINDFSTSSTSNHLTGS
jgi:hypothetical protein